MIKLPEPFRKQGQQLCNDGNTTVFFDAYTEAQLKQAVRDAIEEVAKRVEVQRNDVPANGFEFAAAIRALIKEIE